VCYQKHPTHPDRQTDIGRQTDRHRQKHSQTNRQTDRIQLCVTRITLHTQTDKQNIDRQTDTAQTKTLTDEQTDRQDTTVCYQNHPTHTDRQTDIDRQRDRQTQTNRQRDRIQLCYKNHPTHPHTNKQRYIDRHTHTHTQTVSE